MRQLAVVGRIQSPEMISQARGLAAALLASFVILLSACGGGHSTSTPSSIHVSPSFLSLNLGSVGQISASVVDSSGNTITNPATLSYSSSNSSIATVSTAGAVCAGTWDANFIVCDPSKSQPGTANITITSGAITATVPIYTHLHVDRVEVSPGTINCVSSGQTQQMSAKAFSSGTDITSTVGPFTWASFSVDVDTIDTNGLVTAKTPGLSGITATNSNVTSVPATWVTCPVQSINIHQTGSTNTTISLAAAGSTANLAADLVDSHGVSISAPLNWNSSEPSTAIVNSAALVQAVGPGTASLTASCAGTCNIGLAAVYSNAVIATVGGSSSSTVYATGTGTTTLIPIDTGTNSAGTAVTLPAMPNSLLFDPVGANAYLGSNTGLMVVSTSTNAVTQNTGVIGKVLAVSPDSNRVIVAGSNTTTVLGVGSGIGTDALSAAGVTAAAFTPDSRGAYLLAGNTTYFWSPGTFRAIGLAGTANDVKFLPTGVFAYFAGGAAGPVVTALAACNNAVSDTVATPATPTLIGTAPDGTKVLAVDSPGIDVLTPMSNGVGCPPALSDSVAHIDFGAGSFTARQLIVLPNGSKAYVTSNLGQLLGLNVATATPFAISLAGGANAFTGGTTLDSSKLYVGGSDNTVHRIDVASGTDAQQISVSFTPDLVAVKPK